jgi:hypothetical protein
MTKAAKKSVKVGATGPVKKRPRATGAARQASARPGPPAEGSRTPIHADIRGYNAAQSGGDKRICDALARAINRHLPGAENKIWHRHPVWFLDGNPIVGYHKLKGGGGCIRLLFWSGRSFDERGLAPEGGFKTAGARYTAGHQTSAKDLKRWLGKSIEIQWDYKNIIKRKGRLERLK